MRLLTILSVCLGLMGCSSKVDSDDREPLGPAESHEWTEYRHDDRVDDVACSGQSSDSAVIDDVFFAQTHFMSPDWPDEGNIANPSLGITAENFMDSAELVMELEL